MTVTTTNNTISYEPDGIEVSYVYDFLVLDEAHMEVYFDGVLQSPAGYTVNDIGDPAGGTVDFSVAPPDTVANMVLLRNVPAKQLTDYEPYDAFPADTHEAALDLLTMITQQLQEQIDRAPKGGPGETFDFTLSFGNAAARAGKSWWFDDTGNLVIAKEAAEDLAYRWANAPENEVVENIGGIDRYSAYHWALKAEIIVSLPLADKGDILTTTGGGPNYTVVPVGTDGQVLVADSGQPEGLGWANSPGLPPVVAMDALKLVRVNATGDGYELSLENFDRYIGAGAFAPDDASTAGISSATRYNYGKQITMRYLSGTEQMAWISGVEVLVIERHKTLDYGLKFWFVPETAEAAKNVRWRVDVYKYQDSTNMTKTAVDLTATSADVPLNNNNTERYEVTFSDLVPAAAGEDDEQILAISLSRIPPAGAAHTGSMHVYAALLQAGL